MLLTPNINVYERRLLHRATQYVKVCGYVKKKSGPVASQAITQRCHVVIAWLDEYVGVHLCLSSPRLEYVGVHLCLSSPRLRKVERSITSHDARSSLWSGIIRGFLASNDAVSSTASLSTTANSSTLPSSSPVPSRLHFVVTTVTNSGTIPTSLHRLIDDTNSGTISTSLHRPSDFALKSLLRLRGVLP